jgi:hypothetical protein
LTSYADAPAEIKEQATTILQHNAVTIGENMQILDGFVKTGNSYVYTHPGDKVAAAVFFT